MAQLQNYRLSATGNRLLVKAKSSIHDTQTVWTKIQGTMNANSDDLSSAIASFQVDMGSFDAGDWLKNRKLKKDMNVAKYPTAFFELQSLEDIVKEEDGSFRAKAKGVLKWRNRSVAIQLDGKGSIDDKDIQASGSFVLDITTLGIKPPKFFIFKVDEFVEVTVSFRASVI